MRNYKPDCRDSAGRLANSLLRRRKRESEIELAAPGFPVLDLPAYIGKVDNRRHLGYPADGLRRKPVFVPRYRLDSLLRGLRLILRTAANCSKIACDRSELQYLPRRHLDAGLVGARRDLEYVERVRPQLKEIVIDSDALQPQYLGPDSRHRFLFRVAGCYIGKPLRLFRPGLGDGRAPRSILPFGVNGIASTVTYATGAM